MEEFKCRLFRGDKIKGQAKVIRCDNCQEECHMARQCTKPKRPRNSAWFKEKAMLVEALELRVVLDEEQMKFLTDNGDTESKAKEDKYLDEIIELEKKKKALDNVVYKLGQSTQTMHMLTIPQVFYDECHKTALGYQNPLYLTQAQIKALALYCGNIIVKQHVALSVIDTEETLELAEESILKMHAKQNDPIVKEKKVNITPIDYVALNKLSEHFMNHFVPQKQLSVE
ncbi:hypothetical protein Tco_1517592 [Tanacetum coccineum]